MGTFVLFAWLAAAGVSPDAEEVPPEAPQLEAAPEPEAAAPVVAPEPAPVGVVEPALTSDVWPGEQKRLHFGLGARTHLGVMVQFDYPQLVAQSAVAGVITFRTFGHQEARFQFELGVGVPDLFVGESNLSYRWHLTPRFAIGVGAFVFVGSPSVRAGLEVPFAIRLGETRKHEVGIALRAAAGVFNNSISYVWWDFQRQRFAYNLEATFGYTFIF